jgi:hypothetical protein
VQTGAFHTPLGRFGTVRNQAALDYECFSMLALGTKCAVGDHLPSGWTPEPAYIWRIGRTYRSVREKEPWCEGAKAVAEIGSLLCSPAARANDSDVGVTACSRKSTSSFDFIDGGLRFSRYRLLVLPDQHRLNAKLRATSSRVFGERWCAAAEIQNRAWTRREKFRAAGPGLVYEGPLKHEIAILEALESARDGIPEIGPRNV